MIGFESLLSPIYKMKTETEIRFASENVPRVYGVDARSYEETWARFGEDIERNGMGHYSKVVLFVARKASEAHDREGRNITR